MVSGAIDLLLKRDEEGNILDSHVIDFKSLDAPEDDTPNDWIDLSLQVQLYAYAANEVLGENAKTGSVHLLKEQGANARVDVPVTDYAVSAAIDNITCMCITLQMCWRARSWEARWVNWQGCPSIYGIARASLESL